MRFGRRGLAILVVWAGLSATYAPVLSEEPTSLPPPISDWLSGEGFGSGEGGEFRAPEREPIETDRDSFTPATTLVTTGRTVIEAAYSFLDNRRTLDTNSFPEVVFRCGVAEWLELRLQWNFEVGGAGNLISSGAGDEEFFDPGGVESETQFGYGFKLKITEQKGWIPQSAFLAVGLMPTSGPDQNSSFVLTYVWGWMLPRRWKLDAALRYSAEPNVADGNNLWAPSIVLKIPVWERINLHVEYFAIFSSGKANNTNAEYVSPGLHYLLTNDVEVGFRLGWGLTDDSAKFFVNVGIGWRF